MMESDDRGSVHASSNNEATSASATAADASAGPAASTSASASASPPSASSASSPPPTDLPLNHYMSQSCLPPLRERLELFSLYETRSKLYLVGSPMSGAYYRILKIDRLQADYARLLNAQSNAFCDDGLSYDAAELAELLRMIDQGNASVGGLKELARGAVGVVGFVRFLQGFYLILATSRRLVARIGGHRVYEVTGTEMFALTHPSVYTPDKPLSSAAAGMSLLDKLRGKDKEAIAAEKLKKAREAETAEPGSGPALNANSSKIKTNESKYKSLFLQGLDLNKCFYFCPTGYELSQTLQANMLHAGRMKQRQQQQSQKQPPATADAASAAATAETSSSPPNAAQAAAAASAAAPPPPPIKSMYLWNHFLLSKFYRVMAGQAREDDDAAAAETDTGNPDATRPDPASAWYDDGEDPEGRDDEQGPDSEAACDAAIPHTAVGVAVTRSSPASRRAYLNPAAQWALPLIHGYFVQTHVSVFGALIDLTLLARRSRFFAGTRYLKRGINNAGRVANDVESEQIVWTRSRGSHLEGAYTSYVQVRGSIPLFWSQEGNPLVAQPAIVVTKTDPLHLATRCHAEDLFRRYGSPLLVLNLVKQSEKKKRESIIGEALAESIEFINKFIEQPEHKIDFLAWDFKRVSQSKTHSVVDELGVISQWSLQRTGLFHSRPHPRAFPTSSKSTVSVRPTRESIRQRVSLLDGAGHQITAEKASHLSAKPHRQRHFYSLVAQMAAHAAANTNSSNSGSSSCTSATDASTLVSTVLTGPVPRNRFSATAAAAAYPMPVFPVHYLGFLQRGVVRTNCIDSLDRTNVAQFCLGKCALGYQLFALGVTDSVHLGGGGGTGGGGGGGGGSGGAHPPHPHHHHDPSASSSGVSGAPSTRESASSEIVNILLDLYEGMGDELSQQYGGSAMHRQIRTGQSKDGKNTLMLTQSKSKTDTKELVVSIRRHIQNSFQDNGKQDAINLFLGYFTPPDPALMAAMAAGAVIGPQQANEAPKSVLPTLGTFFPFTMLDHSSTDASAAAAAMPPVPSLPNLGLNLPVHQWDLPSDWYLHNPHTINVINKMQYNVRATRREDKRRRAIERIQRRKQRAAESAAHAGKKGLPSSARSVIPRCSPWSSLLSSARAGLELGHTIYPDQSWWRNPIRDFERPIKGYLPDWLMSFPEATDKEHSAAGQTQPPEEADSSQLAAKEASPEGVDGLKVAVSAAPTVAASSTAEGVPSSSTAAAAAPRSLLLMDGEDEDEESSKESSRAASPAGLSGAGPFAAAVFAAPSEHHPPLYYSNVHGASSGLSSFDELLAPDVYKNHNIRILSAAPGAASGFASSRATVSTPTSASAATPSSGYSSLIPRFLWRRQKAEDEAEDEEGDEEPPTPSIAPLSGIAGGAADASMLDSPRSSSSPQHQQQQQLTSGDHLALPTSWLDPSQRPATSSQLLDGSSYLARFDENDPTAVVIGPRPLGSAHHHARESMSSISLTMDDLPGAAAISPPGSAHGYLAGARDHHYPGGHVLGTLASPSSHASHFSASGPAPRLAASQADAINTAAVYLEYMHAPHLAHLSTAPLTHKSTLLEKHGALTATDNDGGPADAPGSTTFVLSSDFPTANQRKLLHYLEHYTHIRVEHNLIVEPHSEAQLKGQREAIAAAAAAIGAALRANFARQARIPPPVPSKLKPSKRPSHVPQLPPNFVASSSGSGSGAAADADANGTVSASASAASVCASSSPSSPALPSTIDHPNLVLDLPASPPGQAIAEAETDTAASLPRPSDAPTLGRDDSMPEQPALTLSSPGPIPAELLSPDAPSAASQRPSSSSSSAAAAAAVIPPTMGPPPTPLTGPPVFAPSASALAPSNDRRLSSTPSGALMGPPPVVLPGVPPPLPPRKGEGHHHRASLSVDQSGLSSPMSVAVSDGFANGGGVPGGVSVPVFSHAPPNSSISIRNQKRAAFYSAYLRRGDWDAEFLASAFEIARIDVGHAAISQVELDEDKKSREMYAAYVAGGEQGDSGGL